MKLAPLATDLGVEPGPPRCDLCGSRLNRFGACTNPDRPERCGYELCRSLGPTCTGYCELCNAYDERD